MGIRFEGNTADCIPNGGGRILLRMRLLPLICLFAVCGVAQGGSGEVDPKALLLEVRKKVMLTIGKLPRFLCTETIDRATFLPDRNIDVRSCDEVEGAKRWKRRPRTSDRLRLDVAVSNGGEMFSWVGENRFHDQSLSDLVGNGATSTGAFSSFLTSIFGSSSASFTYEGNSEADGRAVVRFGFNMPLESSGYSIGNNNFRATVPYHGTILVDAATHDLARLTIVADRLSKELNSCVDATTLDYGKAEFDNLKFLLPTDAVLHVVYTNLAELENRTTYSGCHKFMGEAKLSFDAPADTGQAAAPATEVKPLVLPAGLPFKIALTQPIDTATAAAGDPVRAALSSAISGRRAGILVPKGAAVTGRIARIERLYGVGPPTLMLSIRLETIEAGGAAQPFPARLESVVEVRKELKNALTPRAGLGTFDQMEDPYGREDVGVLVFEGAGEKYVVRRRQEIVGSTLPPMGP